MSALQHVPKKFRKKNKRVKIPQPVVSQKKQEGSAIAKAGSKAENSKNSQLESQNKVTVESQGTFFRFSLLTIFFRALKTTAVVFTNVLRIDYFLTIFIFMVLILIFLIYYFTYKTQIIAPATVSFPPHSVAPLPIFSGPAPDLSAQSYIVYDTLSRAVVAGKNIHLRFSPASTAKLMTAVIALEHYSLDQIFTANHPEEIEGSKMGLVHGERMSVLNLLYGMLLPSGNDAAHTLARNFPGGEEAFIIQMNEKAASLELSNTFFSDPAGYNDENYTNAFELARLAAYALKNPTFAEIVRTRSITVSSIEGKISHPLSNLNELLNDPEVTGIKTGFTNEAGGVLVTSAVHNGHTFIIIVMKSQDRFADSRVLLHDVVDKTTVLNF